MSTARRTSSLRTASTFIVFAVSSPRPLLAPCALEHAENAPAAARTAIHESDRRAAAEAYVRIGPLAENATRKANPLVYLCQRAYARTAGLKSCATAVIPTHD